MGSLLDVEEKKQCATNGTCRRQYHQSTPRTGGNDDRQKVWHRGTKGSPANQGTDRSTATSGGPPRRQLDPGWVDARERDADEEPEDDCALVSHPRESERRRRRCCSNRTPTGESRRSKTIGQERGGADDGSCDEAKLDTEGQPDAAASSRRSRSRGNPLANHRLRDHRGAEPG